MSQKLLFVPGLEYRVFFVWRPFSSHQCSLACSVLFLIFISNQSLAYSELSSLCNWELRGLCSFHGVTFLQQVQETEKKKPGNMAPTVFYGERPHSASPREAETFKGSLGETRKCSCSWSWPAMRMYLLLTASEKPCKGFLGLYAERKGTGQSHDSMVE